MVGVVVVVLVVGVVVVVMVVVVMVVGVVGVVVLLSCTQGLEQKQKLELNLLMKLESKIFLRS